MADIVSDRALILFCLVLGRRFVSYSRFWPVQVKANVMARLDDLIDDYKEPYGDGMEAELQAPYPGDDYDQGSRD